MISTIRISILILFGVLSHFTFTLQAQNISPVIEKSNQKVIYKGKVYYIHKIDKGNTLYSICKTYQVTKEDIIHANPSAILEPLTIGQVLRIPEISETPAEIQTFSSESQNEDKDFIYHKVQAGETPYFLQKKYNVPLAAIYKYNPGSEFSLSTGQIIKIPKVHLLNSEAPTSAGKQDDIIYYTVQQGDTLYRIAKNYGISVSSLILVNENLRWGLKTGQVLTIPLYSRYDAMKFQMALDSILLASETVKLSASQCDSIELAQKMRTAVKVALILPFYADEKYSNEFSTEEDTVDATELQKKTKTIKGRVATEFYEGLLLAVDSLKKRDIDINLFVYDSEADTNKVKKIIGDLRIIQPDLIFGPFLHANIALVNKFSAENKIPFVPPLMRDDSTIRHNPNLFQIMPSHTSELEIWSDFLSQNYKDNIVFIYKPNLINQKEVDQFKTILLEKFHHKQGIDTLFFTAVAINDSLKYNLNKHLSDSLNNIVIIASSYEPEISDVLTKLHFIHKTKSLKVFGMPTWQKFKNIRIEHFHDLNVSLYSPFFIDYNDPQVRYFVQKCRNKLNYEPFMTTSKGTGINYTFLGYDLGMYFISALKKYGEASCDCIQYYKPELLLSSYSFKRNRIFGFNVNTSISIVQYTQDISIKRSKIDDSVY